MVVCSCRDIRDSHFNSKEELAIRVLADDYCCGKCLEEFLFDGPEIGSTGQRVSKWTARECETRRVGVTQPKKQKT